MEFMHNGRSSPRTQNIESGGRFLVELFVPYPLKDKPPGHATVFTQGDLAQGSLEFEPWYVQSHRYAMKHVRPEKRCLYRESFPMGFCVQAMLLFFSLAAILTSSRFFLLETSDSRKMESP